MTAGLRKVPSIYTPRTPQEAVNLFIDVAGSQIGYREGKSKSGDWNNDTMFGVWYGMNFASWCAIFVSWVSFVAKFTAIIPRHAYTPDGFNWFASRGLADGRKPPNRKGVEATGRGKPRPGDIMYVYSSSQGRIHHVGIVEQVLSNGSIKTIEGNTDPGGSAQGIGVFRLTRQISSRLYFCHPNYAAVAKAAKPGGNVVTPPKEEEDPMAGITLAQIQSVAKTAAKEAISEYMAGLYDIKRNGTAGKNHAEVEGLLREVLRRQGLTDADVDEILAKVEQLVPDAAAGTPQA